MKLTQGQDTIRRAMAIWILATVVYLVTTVFAVAFVAHTDYEEMISILILTILYALVAMSILQRVVDEQKAYKKQLETMLLTEQQTESTLQRRLREELLLNQVIATAASAREPTQILEIICKELALALDLPQAGVALLNNERTDETVVAEYRTPERPTALGIVIPIAGNLATQEVIEKREPLMLLNAQTDPRQSILHELEKKRGTVSLLIVPLVVRNEAIGTLGLESPTPREFTAEEINLAQNVANAASQVLESARLTNELRRELGERRHAEEALRERNAELDLLNVTTIDLIDRRDPQDLLESIVSRAAALMKTTDGFLFFVDPEKQTLMLKIGVGRFAHHLGLELKRGQGVAGTVWKTGEPLAVEKYAEWAYHTPGFEWIYSAICTPIRSRAEIVGVLGVTYSESARPLDAEDIELIDRFGRLASLALENANLYDKAQQELAQRRETEEKLQKLFADVERAQTKARSILDAAADSMLLITTDQKIVSVNWSFCRNFFGKHPREVVGHTLQDHQEEFERLFEDPAEFRRLMENASQENDQSSASIVVQVSPRRREMQLVSTPVRTITNEYLGRLFVFHDITKEREVNRLRNEFVSMVSHELRAPLTSIKGYVDLLQGGAVGVVNPEQSDFLGIIKENTDRLVTLISDLLDISRIEAGRLELRRESIDLALLIRQVVNTLRPAITAKRQQIKMELERTSLMAWVDRDRIIQVLTNLISNAHKYTPAEGIITISAAILNDHTCVEIRDNGIGIAEKDLGFLFSQFYRTNNAIAQKVEGTGLGLAITRSLVEMHGGQIAVESELGLGTTFRLTLPTLPSVDQPAKEIAVGQGKQILVADPDTEMAGLIERYLARAGFKTIVATRSEDILWIAQTSHLALLTLSLMWPNTDGFRILEVLKNNSITRTIPVMIISSLAEIQSGKLLGAMEYLAKPFNDQELLKQVAQALKQKPIQKILVAQEDTVTRQMVNSLLTRAGYDVVEAANDDEAIRIAQEQQPGLIFLHLKLPGCGGIGTVEQLRTDQATAKIPVVIMADSEGISDDERARAAEWHAPTILTKPFTASKLATAIYQAMHV